MKYKHIEASREARLWLGQIIIPAFTAGAMLMSNDNVRRYATEKCYAVKNKIKNKFDK